MKTFANLRLDVTSKSLWSQDGRVPLAPRAFSVLAHLVEHADRVVSHDELLDAVWPNQDVQPEILKKYILEVRKALGDNPRDSLFIENVPRVGYKFCMPVATQDAEVRPAEERLRLVERDADKAVLRNALSMAAQGEGRMVCLSGEAGIGKTSLVRGFFSEGKRKHESYVAVGSCAEQSINAALSPFLEIVEALLTQEPHENIAKLEGLIPSWINHVRSQRSITESAHTHLDHLGDLTSVSPSQDRIKRELGALLAHFSKRRPILLLIDDVHWADNSTVDMISFLTQRLSGLRVLLCCTYRPSELLRLEHPFLPLRLHLRAHGLCEERELSLLTPAAVDQYLELKYPENSFTQEFRDLVYSKTDGSPLFVTDLVQYLNALGQIRHDGSHWRNEEDMAFIRHQVPESTRSMVALKISRLADDERELLFIASLQGIEFDSATLAIAMDLDAVATESQLMALSDKSAVVRILGEQELPSHVLTLCFEFAHALYHEAINKLAGPAKRAATARRMAEALQLTRPGGLDNVAAQMGSLRLLARDFEEAGKNFLSASQYCARIYANKEALSLAESGLLSVRKMPSPETAAELELQLQLVRGASLTALKGWPNAAADAAYKRAEQLSSELDDHGALIGALYGKWNGLRVRGDIHHALAIALKIRETAAADSALDQLIAHHSCAMTYLFAGNYRCASEHAAAGMLLYTPERDKALVERFQRSSGALVHSLAAITAWITGEFEAGLVLNTTAVAIADQLGHVPSQAGALGYSGILHALRNDPVQVLDVYSQFLLLREDEALFNWHPFQQTLQGWARVKLHGDARGIPDIETGLSALEDVGVRLSRTFLLSLLADAHYALGRYGACITVVDQALREAASTGDLHGKAELLSLKAQSIHATLGDRAARKIFNEAVKCATEQGGSAVLLRIQAAAANSLPGLKRDRT